MALVLGTPAGYALSRSKFRGSRAVSVGLISIYIAPALVYIVPLYVLYQKLHLTGSYTSLVLYYETFELPFVTFMMRGFFSDIPLDLDDAAQGRWWHSLARFPKDLWISRAPRSVNRGDPGCHWVLGRILRRPDFLRASDPDGPS